MPFRKILVKRQSLNLEQLRKQEWGQDYADNITQVSRPQVTNGEMMPVSTTSPELQTVDWGEEKVDGAIYHVVLKKVRYHTTNKLPFNEFVSHLEWETRKRRTIKAGSLVKLIEHLSPANECIDEVDPGFLIAFLTMYQTFSSAEEVVSLLLDRFRRMKRAKCQTSENVMRGTVKVLLVWLEHFPDDFKKDPSLKLLKQIQTFARNELKGDAGRELIKKTQQVMDRVVSPAPDMADPSPPSSCNEDCTDGCENTFFSKSSCGLGDFETTEIAEQLTLIDADLFKAVIPQHCVGCIWGRRDKNDNSLKTSSVSATVNQFNAVSHRVTSTILLGDMQGSPSLLQRAKKIEAWIEIAQECRDLKNFSSLKAIVSALQSVSIHRLKKTWASVSRNHILSFEELSKLVSEECNQQSAREVLMREGTAKNVENKKKSSLNRKGSQKMQFNCQISGTVPYLGTFLTDLTMLDSYHPDFIDGNLINFEKRQKEFEIIAQIKLFQKSAKNYHILPNKEFRIWFDSLETLTENESFRISCNLEANSIAKRQTSLFRSRKMKSENDLVRVGSTKEDGHDQLDSCKLNHKRQDSSSSCASEGSAQFNTSGHIIRVSVEQQNTCNLYKSIWVSDGDKTPRVIYNCLTKHHLDPQVASDYNLIQILSHGDEVTIPSDGNVYYAINTKSQPLSFILRKKTEEPQRLKTR